MSSRVMRIGLVVLLVGGAHFAARPWLTCVFPFGPGRWYPEMWGLCAFGLGDPLFDRTGPGPLWPNLIIGAIYLLAALYIARAHVAIDAPGTTRPKA